MDTESALQSSILDRWVQQESDANSIGAYGVACCFVPREDNPENEYKRELCNTWYARSLE